jgi:hypothetical protein
VREGGTINHVLKRKLERELGAHRRPLTGPRRLIPLGRRRNTVHRRGLSFHSKGIPTDKGGEAADLPFESYEPNYLE